MLQYEELSNLKARDIVYYVGESDDYEDYEGGIMIWELKYIGSTEEKCMLECPNHHFYRFDVYKDKENTYPMFSTKIEAEDYLKSLKNEIHESIQSMSTEEILDEIFRVYQSCFHTYEVPYTRLSKDELDMAKRILKERLVL